MLVFTKEEMPPYEIVEEVSLVEELREKITVIFHITIKTCWPRKPKNILFFLLIVPSPNLLTRLLLDHEPEKIFAQLIASGTPLTSAPKYQGGLSFDLPA